MNDIIERIKAAGLENDDALAEAIDSAKDVKELIEVLAARGISATETELTGVDEKGELTEGALENVAGGIGFFNGYVDGMNGKAKRYKNPVYGLGYKCGSLIGGHATSW